jgi:7,8-dihydro-6-hydroxymethylpterin-pyrophosphokinase
MTFGAFLPIEYCFRPTCGVLAPPADLNPDLRHPVTHRTVKEVLEAVPEQAVRKLLPN